MVDTIIAHERFSGFVDEDRRPTQRGAEYIEAITRQANFSMILTGTGSPEGVLAASPTRQYMDTSGGAGTILYIKKTGNGNTGWVLV